MLHKLCRLTLVKLMCLTRLILIQQMIIFTYVTKKVIIGKTFKLTFDKIQKTIALT